jgi:hypothetical protein
MARVTPIARATRWPLSACVIDRVGKPTLGGDHVKKMTSARLFGGPERMRKTNQRIARAELLTASARERGIELAQKYESSPRGRRTEAHRRRLTQLQSL